MSLRPSPDDLQFEVVDPDGPEARDCLARYFEELADRFEEGFDPAKSLAATLEDFRQPRGSFVVGRVRGRAVACGGVTRLTDDAVYLKRMWVDPDARGLGLGRRLLESLEDETRALGCTVVRLETNRVLREAIRMYQRAGYAEVEPFNDEFYAHHWFEKTLDAGVAR